MRAVWAGVSCVALTSCWYFEDCPDNLGGIKEGQRLQTTIVAPFERGGPEASCGELGDLPPGALVKWLAHLDGSSEGCDDHVEPQVQSLSGAEVTRMGIGTTIRLPGGCEGEWWIQLVSLSDGASLLGPSNVSSPAWLWKRSFLASRESTVCPGSVSAERSCSDYFVASTQVLEGE